MCFMLLQNNEKYAKYVRKLVAVQAFGDFCVLATKVGQLVTVESSGNDDCAKLLSDTMCVQSKIAIIWQMYAFL